MHLKRDYVNQKIDYYTEQVFYSDGGSELIVFGFGSEPYLDSKNYKQTI